MIRRMFVERRMWLFLLWVLAVAVVATLLNSERVELIDDAHLLFGAAVIIAVSALIMFISGAPWTLQRLGIFGLIVFDALLYGTAGASSIWGWPHVTPNTLNWIRAVVIVSAPMLLAAQLAFGADRLRGWRRDRKRRNEVTS